MNLQQRPLLAASPGAGAQPPGHAVVAGTPEAAAAGSALLDAGGNAADAAVAVALVLAVTEPAGSGLGGTASVVIHGPATPAAAILAPSLAPRELPNDIEAKALRNHRAATVPSFLRVLEILKARFGAGAVTWAQCVEPAIRCAEDGVRLGRFRYRSLLRNAHLLRKRPSVAAVFLHDNGAVPPPEATLRQPALARTLRRLAAVGPGDFYEGEIARAIAADMAEHRGWITLDDLRRFPTPEVEPALAGSYRGFTVHTLPPPSGGWVLLQALNLLELAPADELVPGHVNQPIWMAETLKVAYRSRRRQPLSDGEQHRQRAEAAVGKARARVLFERLKEPDRGETTHFSIIDADGLAVAVSQSLDSNYGARVLTPRLGFLYNNYMSEFTTNPARPRHPFRLRAGAAAYSSMACTILTRDGRAELVLGSPGGGRIVSAVLQATSAWVDGGRSIEAAVAAPRMHYTPATKVLQLERMLHDQAQILGLQKRSFTLSVPVTTFRFDDRDSYFGGVNAVAREGGRHVGAADPRRDGAVR